MTSSIKDLTATLSISDTELRITVFNCFSECCSAEWHSFMVTRAILLSVILPSVILPSVILPSVILPSVILPSVILPTVVVPMAQSRVNAVSQTTSKSLIFAVKADGEAIWRVKHIHFKNIIKLAVKEVGEKQKENLKLLIRSELINYSRHSLIKGLLGSSPEKVAYFKTLKCGGNVVNETLRASVLFC